MKHLITTFFFFTILLQTALAQRLPNQSTLSIEQIMQGEEFVGYLPSQIRWSHDNRHIYFSWNPEMDTMRATYKVPFAGGEPQKVGVEELKALPSSGVYNKDYTLMAYAKNGDLFLLNLETDEVQQITNTTERESNPQFSGDERHLVFTKSSDLYTWSIENGTISQLTNFQKEESGQEQKKADWQEWLEEDQLAHFEILRERKATRETQERRNELKEPDRPLAIYYGSKRVSNIQASPDLNFVTFRLTKDARGNRTLVPNYVTESGFTDSSNARTKVGSPQDTYEMGVYDIQADTFYMIDTKQIEGIYDKPAFLMDYHTDTIPFEAQYDTPKEVLIHGPIFSEDGKAVVVVRSLDNKDRWIMLLDLPTGNLTTLDWQHDEAWIGGPGISGWNFSSGNIGWLADNQTLYYQSEATGFSHLYTVNVETGEKNALTNGKFEILEASLSRDKTRFYITANREGPEHHHFYHLPVNGGELQKITSLPGNHEVTLSPNEQHLAIRYSYANRPWELYHMENRAGAAMKRLTQSTTTDFEKYKWRDPEIVRFKARDGATVSARLYRPQKAKRNGPAVIFVHGAGYLQNVHKWWSSYYREYMFHNILTDNGYTVLDIDYRGSAGYGRNWRVGIYRHMGGKDLDDQVDGAKFLVDQYNIDPEKIGIYGGSYGGFITLMAQFTAPGTFKSGAALRSVTDWAHYNHPYTSNILNTPVADSIAYRKSSPIYHAEGLEDHLLILHGMLDDNVQFQDVVRLAQRLIELGKDNWEFAVFPLERHGFVEPSSWADEYKRIFKLFQETLKE